MAKVTVPALIALAFCLQACHEENPNRQAQLEERLFESVRQDKPELADSCLRAGARLEARNAEGATPLILAASLGRKGVAQVLLDKGADVKARRAGYYGSTALMEAAISNDTAMARLLLSRGADVHRRDTFGDPA
ncbi:MAG: ankyrin repeat domain-containing protein, partial [Phaeodactylibacter sp.]|nr:ankyrin repeat domain-containing protein [Phaeodactylibacter sp.]